MKVTGCAGCLNTVCLKLLTVASSSESVRDDKACKGVGEQEREEDRGR